jgi:LSD1 subclass zinc finger protein
MAGRNGSDNLCRFLSVVVCVLLVCAVSLRGNAAYALWVLAIAGLVYCYFRILSRNVEKRRQENSRYLAKREAFLGYFRGAKERHSQRKDYRFFRCPSCRTMLRVPRGKGKVKIVCRKCGTSFIKKT